MRHLRLALALVLLALPAAAAADRAEVERLWKVMEMEGVIEVMRQEGLDYGRDLDADMLNGNGGAGFTAMVEGIYDTSRMSATTLDAFEKALDGKDVAAMLAFFEGELGTRAISLELSARQALLDPDVEQASHERVAEMRAGGDPRIRLLTRFVESNDLVESNVMGALNSNYAFYQGMQSGGVLEEGLSEQDILQDVWSQEPDIRVETEDWVYGFLALAYQPLSDDELGDYIAFSETAAGQDLNRAIFVAFDGMFNDISRAMGAGVSRFMAGEEL